MACPWLGCAPRPADGAARRTQVEVTEIARSAGPRCRVGFTTAAGLDASVRRFAR